MTYNRRNFIKKSSLGAIAASTLSINCQNNLSIPREGIYMGDFSDKPMKKIKAAFIGLNRGGSHLRNFATIENTEVVALCDLYENNVKRELERLYQYSPKTSNVKTYWGDENNWKIMLKEVRPDVVFISTNWNNHAPMAIESMKAGSHAFVEVPLAVTLEEMWDIVNTSEKTQKHCMMLENVNYGRVVEVLDELRKINNLKIAISTQ